MEIGRGSIDGGYKSRLFAITVALVLAVPASTAMPSFAEAQESQREQRRGLFDLLFGGALRQREPQKPVTRQRSAPRKQQGTSRRRSSAPAAPSQPPPSLEVEKLDNARVILVVGDFLAGGLAEGLSTAYSESPGVRVVNRSNGSSGFVRDDYYDWNTEIAGILDDLSPAVVVMMIGSNDRQQLIVDGKREAPRSEAWVAEYTQRVEAFAAAIEDRQIPLVWSGLPSFKSSTMSSDMLAFNDIYKTTVEAIDGSFVDIWDGFVDENGGFVFTGPDMNGQPVRLRGSDGINLTRAGKRKVAFYVEKPLNKLLGEAVSPDIGELGIESLPALVLHPENPAPVNRTMPISLSDPSLDGGLELMGAVVKPIQRQKRIESEGGPGETETQPGRADNFSLPTRKSPKSKTPPEPSAQATP
ncbi:DUF459 domain-containing protein [Nitratireductor kimnyeongensis]|uniref:DUF459 domain-containing protein n=1 Tax=Nitratireductor kimnyeongensis TaxID=430679 RepID=A0ABW0T8V2_9HYPH|nr:DUF459 domain-containing protein [Nitratireductor kimnyeongensis]QZZ36294.1 DUF459 domain-containing protein [Nitratireductor kimnyeongensis]